jgi:hypothetical protein
MIQLPIYNGQPISVNDEMLCLTDMWKAAGSPDNKDPWRWSQTQEGSDYIEAAKENLNHAKNVVWKTGRGRGGGTWAHWQIGFTYAQYLSPEFHIWCNEVVYNFIMGQANRAQIRVKGKKVRRQLTHKLTDHDVRYPCEFQSFTNEGVYKPLLGGAAPEIRKERGLPPGENLRERGLTDVELASVLFAETLAIDRIAGMGLYGVEKCTNAASVCSKMVKTVVVEERANRAQLLMDSA